MLRRAVGLAVLAVALVAPQQALGVDFYASQAGGGDCLTPSTPCDLATALTNASNTVGESNVRVIGPLTHIGSVILDDSDSTIHLIGSGSGPGGTFIDRTGSVALELSHNATAQNLRLRASSGDTVTLGYGSSLSDAVVENTVNVGVNVVFGSVAPALIERTTITANGIAVTVGNGGAGMSLVMRDSTLSGQQGVNHTGGVPVSMTLQRNTINASVRGVDWIPNPNVNAYLSSNVIHMTGDSSDGIAAISAGGASDLFLLDNTIDGTDTTGDSNGIDINVGSTTPFQPIVAHVRGSIVRGFRDDLIAQGSASNDTPGGEIRIANSDFATAREEAGGPSGHSGEIVDEGGNVNADPLFADRAGGNYGLLVGSPLIDAGGTGPIDTTDQESDTDRSGGTRILDGNGDGVAARDMGALEFVRPAALPGLPPPGPALAALFRLRSGTLTISRTGVIKVPVQCDQNSPVACSMAVLVQSSNRVRGAGRRRTRARIITLGRGRGTLVAGKRGTIRVKLTRRALKAFRGRKFKRAKVTVSSAQGAAAAKKAVKTYRLKAAPRKRKRRR